MTDFNDLFFELSDSGDSVKLEPLERINFDSDIDWDKNWVKTIVTVKGGKFSGNYTADIMTVDFEKFKQELSVLYDNLGGSAHFYDVERYLELKIKGDGIGHFEVDVRACDEPGVNASELTFTMTFDQTQIKGLVRQLDLITNHYPIVGDLKIKNK